MSSKKFLVVTNHSYMLWQFRKELIEELLKRGEVVISTPFVGHEQDLAALGCRLIETPFSRRSINPLGEWKLYRTYLSIIRREKPDLTLTYSIKPNLYAGFACMQYGVPYAANVQGLGTAFQRKWLAPIAGFLYKKSMKNAQMVFFENKASADLFTKKHIVSREKQTVLSGAGVNLKDYPLKPYPSEENGIHILFLGRIMKEKGADEFLGAAKKLKAEYGDKVIFDVVGFYEDNYRSTVETMVKDGIIRFHGFQENPRPWYAKAHCVVLPSYHEGMSNVLLEGAATGRALIASDIPGCREAIEAGITGYLVPPRNTDALVSALKAFLGLSPAEREEMGLKGREKKEREFNRMDVVKQALLALYL